MPIEIRELVIRVTVRDGSQPAAGEPGSVEFAGEEWRRRQELVSTCVRQVLNELDRQRER